MQAFPSAGLQGLCSLLLVRACSGHATAAHGAAMYGTQLDDTLFVMPTLGPGACLQCAASSLGYACSAGVGSGIALHWTAGGEGPPSNMCTAGSSTSSDSTGTSTTASSTASFVHFAITTRQSGYVALAFAAKSGRMSPATAIVGRLTYGAPSVEVYSISGYSIGTQMATNQVAKSGVVSTSEGGLMLCFSVEAKNVPAGGGGGSGGASRRRGRALAQALEGLDSTGERGSLSPRPALAPCAGVPVRCCRLCCSLVPAVAVTGWYDLRLHRRANPLVVPRQQPLARCLRYFCPFDHLAVRQRRCTAVLALCAAMSRPQQHLYDSLRIVYSTTFSHPPIYNM